MVIESDYCGRSQNPLGFERRHQSRALDKKGHDNAARHRYQLWSSGQSRMNSFVNKCRQLLGELNLYSPCKLMIAIIGSSEALVDEARLVG